MKSKETPSLRKGLKQIGCKDYVSDDEDYELAPSYCSLRTKTNNFFNEKILSGKYFASDTKLDKGEEEKSNLDSIDRITDSMKSLQNKFKLEKINETIADLQNWRFENGIPKMRCHSVESFDDRAYYDSSQFNVLIKALRAKVDFNEVNFVIIV